LVKYFLDFFAIHTVTTTRIRGSRSQPYEHICFGCSPTCRSLLCLFHLGWVLCWFLRWFFTFLFFTFLFHLVLWLNKDLFLIFFLITQVCLCLWRLLRISSCSLCIF
jgi:hypothetical protein